MIGNVIASLMLRELCNCCGAGCDCGCLHDCLYEPHRRILREYEERKQRAASRSKPLTTNTL